MRLSNRLAIIGVVAAGFCLSGLPLVHAQPSAPTQSQLDISALRAQRKAVYGENMRLSPQEAKAFWPLFDEYQAKADKIEDRRVKELKEYARNYDNLTNDDAAKKLDEVMAINQARFELQKQYIPKFRAALSQITVTRFFQIDNKLRAMNQCAIAQAVPLARPTTNQ